MIHCRQCGEEMMDRVQAQEMQSEIMASGASIEGRMQDMNDIDLCSRCLNDQVYREMERDDSYDY